MYESFYAVDFSINYFNNKFNTHPLLKMFLKVLIPEHQNSNLIFPKLLKLLRLLPLVFTHLTSAIKMRIFYLFLFATLTMIIIIPWAQNFIYNLSLISFSKNLNFHFSLKRHWDFASLNNFNNFFNFLDFNNFFVSLKLNSKVNNVKVRFF